MAYDAILEQRKKGNPYDSLAGSADPSRPMASGAQPAAAPAAQPLGAGGPTATGHVNFDQIYDANAGVSQREAGNRQSAIDAKAATAQSGLTGAQSKFKTGLTGAMNSAPKEEDYLWAAYGDTGVNHGKQATGAYNAEGGQSNVTPGDQSYVSESQEALTSPVVRTKNGGAYDSSNDSRIEGDVRKGATGSYEGPGSLSAMDEYGKLTEDTAAAQDFAKNPLVGLGRTDAALLGAAGRPGFADREAKYGHLKDDLLKANAESIGQGDLARKTATDNANAYQSLLGSYDERKGGDQAAEDAATKRSNSIVGGAADDAGKRSAFMDYLHGGSGLDQTRNALHTGITAIDPSEWAASAFGEQGGVQRGTNALSPMSATNKGNVWSGWKDTDYDVWSSMSQSDWDEFAGLDDAGKHAWIETRRAQTKGGK